MSCKVNGVTEQNLPQCRLVHQKSELTCHGFDLRQPILEDRD
jgi:hypothetical protein